MLLAVGVALATLCTPVLAQSSVREVVGTGTGFIVSSDGYILTNEHVIDGPSRITVTVGGTAYQTRVVASDKVRDLALLKLVRPVGTTGLTTIQGLPTVVLGDVSRLSVGDAVYAIGCPDGICGTVTAGAVANLGVRESQFIMTDVTIAHGNSGGPLLDGHGRVVGITSQGLVQETSGQILTTGFSFSIPISQASPLLKDEQVATRTGYVPETDRNLSAAEILDAVGPAVVYVEAAQLIPLEAFLPEELLDLPLRGPSRSWQDQPRLWKEARSVVESSGARVDEASFATYAASGFPNMDIVVGVFDLETEEQARSAAEMLADPVVALHTYGPPDAAGTIVFCSSTGESGRCASGVPGTSCIEQYARLLERNKPLGNGTLTITARLMIQNRVTETYDWLTSSSLLPRQPLPFRPVTTSVQGEVGFLGAATLALGDVVFFIRLLVTESTSTALTECTVDSSNCVLCSGKSFPTLDADDFMDSLYSVLDNLINAIKEAVP